MAVWPIRSERGPAGSKQRYVSTGPTPKSQCNFALMPGVARFGRARAASTWGAWWEVKTMWMRLLLSLFLFLVVVMAIYNVVRYFTFSVNITL